MTFPILVQQADGAFTASVLGSPALSAAGATKQGALDALRANIDQRFAHGELMLMDLGDPAFVGISGLAGKYKDDPSLREICKEAYRLRDAERDAEVNDADRP